VALGGEGACHPGPSCEGRINKTECQINSKAVISHFTNATWPGDQLIAVVGIANAWLNMIEFVLIAQVIRRIRISCEI
jgi:hypothetical protein